MGGVLDGPELVCKPSHHQLGVSVRGKMGGFVQGGSGHPNFPKHDYPNIPQIGVTSPHTTVHAQCVCVCVRACVFVSAHSSTTPAM